jgi:sulfur carrier protein ThiS
MIRLLVGTNTERKNVNVNPEDTLKSVLDREHINVTGSALHLDGSLIPGVDATKTFTQLGLQDGSEHMLIAVVKADSAR